LGAGGRRSCPGTPPAASIGLLGYYGGQVAKTIVEKTGTYGVIVVLTGATVAFFLYRRRNRRKLEELGAEASADELAPETEPRV